MTTYHNEANERTISSYIVEAVGYLTLYGIAFLFMYAAGFKAGSHACARDAAWCQEFVGSK